LIAEKPNDIPYPDPNDTSLGAELKRRRLELEWSQKDCAKHFGVLKDSYQKWEWNQIIPVIHRRKEVCDFLGFNYWDDGSGSIGNRLLLYRIEMGLSQEELEPIIQVPSRTISRIENNKAISNKLYKYIINLLKKSEN